MEINTFFLDTYALVEIAKGNKGYTKFFRGRNALNNLEVTTKLNLMELYYSLLRGYNEQIAEKHYSFYSRICINIPDKVIMEAMKFKLKYKREKLSYVDCIGYVLSINSGFKFVTGDQKFKDFPNVVFIK